MRLGKKSWTLLIIAAVLAVFGWSVMQRLLDVAAVQDCLNRDWETSFGPDIVPAALPQSLDVAIASGLNRRYAGHPAGADQGRDPEHAGYRDLVYHERFRALFRGTIREIHIIDPEGFRRDPGAALQRFPGLRRVTVQDLNNDAAPSEAQWKLLCAGLRPFPELDELILGGHLITDEAVSPLAGHPTLRTVRVRFSRLTPECAKTFRTMPRLTTIYLNTVATLTPEDQATWSAALPGVVINSRQNEP